MGSSYIVEDFDDEVDDALTKCNSLPATVTTETINGMAIKTVSITGNISRHMKSHIYFKDMLSSYMGTCRHIGHML